MGLRASACQTKGDQIHLMADSRCSADPFVMISSVKCFSHHRTPYAVCSDSIIWLCVRTPAPIYSHSNPHAFPGPHTQAQAWSKQLLYHLLFQLLFYFFWRRRIAFTHHKIRKIAGMTDIEIPPRTTNRVRYSYKGYPKIESRRFYSWWRSAACRSTFFESHLSFVLISLDLKVFRPTDTSNCQGRK